MNRTSRVAAASAGIAAVVFGVGVGELVGLLTGGSPIAAVGSMGIDFAPPWAKDLAIELFGTGDKAALIVGVLVTLVLAAAVAGLIERRAAPWGRALIALIGMVGVAAAVTRADAGALSAVAPAVSAAAAIIALRLLMRRAPVTEARRAQRPEGPADADPTQHPGTSRRAFLVWSAAAAGIGVLAAAAGTAVRSAATAVREAIVLPKARTTFTAPAGTDFAIADLSPAITPTDDFYRIDTALVIPDVNPATWELRIHGLVENEITLTFDELLARPLDESVTTLTCVSNTVGGDLIGTAVWLGYPIRELLAEAVPLPDADMVLSTSVDGFTAGTPIEALTDDRNAILAVGMNGEPLPALHGSPVRMVVPGLYGYVSATKWVVDLEVTRFADAKAYWSTRGWTERGPIKLQSRIDVPRAGTTIQPRATAIAGVAWQQHTGIEGVEVQIDDGPWQAAELATPLSEDTWVQWKLDWEPTSGSHTIRCRATSVTGETQTSDQAPPAPDGATGWHEIPVTVA